MHKEEYRKLSRKFQTLQKEHSLLTQRFETFLKIDKVGEKKTISEYTGSARKRQRHSSIPRTTTSIPADVPIRSLVSQPISRKAQKVVRNPLAQNNFLCTNNGASQLIQGRYLRSGYDELGIRREFKIKQ